MKIKNIGGKSQNKCSCGSWLKHWRNHSGTIATVCRAICCQRGDLLGTHVQKDVSYDKHWYIVPLCAKHARAKGKVELIADTRLVRAELEESVACEK